MTESIIFIIDKSSPVKPYLEVANEILKTKRSDTLLTCAFFNEKIDYKCIITPVSEIKDIRELDIQCSGSSAFYDNVGGVIYRMKQFYDITRHKPPLVVIFSEGKDTASKILTATNLALQIEECKMAGWQFAEVKPRDINDIFSKMKLD